MRDTILVADDVEMNRAIIAQLFEETYTIIEAVDGQETLDLLNQHRDSIAVVLLDIMMPKMNGLMVLREMVKCNMLDQIPVILITSANDSETQKQAYELGVSDIIQKPFDSYVVMRRIENVCNLYSHKNNLEDIVREQTKKLREQAEREKTTNDFVIDTLSTIVEFRDLESGSHILRIRNFVRLLLECYARHHPDLGYDKDRINNIVSASAMHDIGKIATPDAILLKPGRLTPEEFEIMKQHTVQGCNILSKLKYINDNEFFQYCYDICRSHHERWDGHGYPDGLKGDAIPLSARIVAIADVYDALVSDRVYKKAFTHEQAIHMICDGECGSFEPELLEYLIEVQGDFLRFVVNERAQNSILDNKA